MQKSLKVFLVCAVVWEIAVGLLYGFLIGYSQSSFSSMQSGSSSSYSYASDSNSVSNFTLNSTQFPFPHIVTAIAIIFLIVGNFISI